MIIATHLIIHAGNKKEITAVSVVLYVMKDHVHSHKLFYSFDFLDLGNVL
jgi:hypothetical protein